MNDQLTASLARQADMNSAARIKAAIRGKDVLNDTNLSQMRNALVVAAERFDDNAAMFRQIADLGKTDPEAAQKASGPMVNWTACGPLADDFERQARDTRGLIDWIDGPEDEDYEGRTVAQLTITRQVTFED